MTKRPVRYCAVALAGFAFVVAMAPVQTGAQVAPAAPAQPKDAAPVGGPTAPAVQPPTAADASPTPEAAPAAPAVPSPGAPPAAEAPAVAEPAPEPAPAAEAAPVAVPAATEEPEPEADDASDQPMGEEYAEDDADEIEEIVVTGSRIKRSSFAASAPVEVISREDLEYSGANNVADVVRYLTAAGSSDTWGRAQGSGGVATVSLRGLGPSATLVLINGRRIMPSSSGLGPVQYDIGLIPVASIERIEILRGGASAIYGADAVAGVLNIITRKDYTGLRLETTASTTDDFDHHELELSMGAGASTERSRVNVGVSYNYRSELAADERDWTKGTVDLELGNPASFIVRSMAAAVPDPDCAMGKNSHVDADRGLCIIDFRSESSLVSEHERIATYGYGEYDVTDHTAAFTELTYRRLRDQTTAMASFPTLPSITIPADHIDNPFGEDVVFLGRVLPAEAGPGHIQAGDDTFRVVAGLKGDFEGIAANTLAEDWEWELASSWSSGRYYSFIPVETIPERLQEAVNSCSDPADLSGCFNPFYSAYTGEGTPNSQEVINSIMGDLQWGTNSSLTTLNADLTGSLLELPGGDLAFALGGQYRHQARFTNGGDRSSELGYGFFFGFAEAAGERDTGAGYAELQWPLVDGIVVTTAGRVEHANDFGSSVSPSVGVIIEPAGFVGRQQAADEIKMLRFRGHLSRAFRAPSLSEVFPGSTTAVAQFEEGGVPILRGVRAFGNPDLTAEKATTISGGLSWAPIDEIALTALYWYYNYTDRIINEDPVQKFMTDPNGEDIIRDPQTGQLLTVHVIQENVDSTVTHGLDFGTVLRFDVGTDNVLSVAAQGTYIASFEVPLDRVTVNTLDDGSETMIPECDGDRCETAGLALGLANRPRLRLNVPLTFTSGEHSLSLITRFISGVDNGQDFDGGSGEYGSIDAFTTFDLQYGYTVLDWVGTETNLRLGVINLLDSDPPSVPSAVWGYSAGLHDPRGRIVYAKLSQQF